MPIGCLVNLRRQDVCGWRPSHEGYLKPSYDSDMNEKEKTQVSDDGLRYKSRAAGSPFDSGGHRGSMSCIKCGLHKSRALGSFRKVIGKSTFFCESCSIKKNP